MTNVMTPSRVIEIRENNENTLACLLETTRLPSAVLINKKSLGEHRPYIKPGEVLIVETRGPLDLAGSELVALYKIGERKPFYTHQ